MTAPAWKVPTEHASTQKVYVSSSIGDDTYDGSSGTVDGGGVGPKQTIDAARALLRNGQPDWLLFKRGDTFSDLSGFGGWEVGGTGGLSEADPQLWGAYGSGARPIIQPPVGADQAMKINHTVAHVMFDSLHLQANPGESVGVGVVGVQCAVDSDVDDLLFQSCKIEGFLLGLNIKGTSSSIMGDVTLRGCVVVDCNPNGGSAHSQGLYCHWLTSITIEDCVFDHNGWAEVDRSDADDKSQGIYIDNEGAPTAIVRRCIISQSSAHGLQCRPGGTVSDNLVIANPIGILLGGGDAHADTHTNGVSGSVTDNVVLDGTDINSGSKRGWGIETMNIGAGGATIARNLIANNASTNTNNPHAIRLFGEFGTASGVGVNNVDVTDNVVYEWIGPVVIEDAPATPPSPASFSTFSGNTFSGNKVSTSDAEPAVDSWFANDAADIAFSGNTYYTGAAAGAQMSYNNADVSFATWESSSGDTGSSNANPTYTDASRTIASYSTSIGGAGTFADFISSARDQSRDAWDDDLSADTVNAYFRAGFDIEAAPAAVKTYQLGSLLLTTG